jgi:putative transposase
MGTHWKNYYTDNCVHHVTGTVHKWQRALLYPRILKSLYAEFNYSISRWNISFIGYVIMPEHFHALLFSEKGDYVQKAIHGIRRGVSESVKEIIESKDKEFRAYCGLNDIDPDLFYTGTCEKTGFRFWKEKPRVFPIDVENEVRRKLDYIHNNPYRRGLVKSAGDWEHSSFKDYYCDRLGQVPVGLQPKQVVE